MDPLLEALRLIASGDMYVWNVILRSLQISGSALLLAMIIGLPIGIAVGLTRFRLRLPLVAVINAGLAFPPVVVGLGVFLVLSRAGPLGDLQLLYTPAA
ncbi:MAG: tungstate transporter permease, partial [Gemmatimonadales bacterium]|nr:tungstate transporter permease [Candidatus Palauibacter denitrificans]